MKKCFHCLREEPAVTFDGVEHLIPEAFGTFGSDTPTLDSVCDDCNGYYARTLDIFLSRESLEGITRYHNPSLRSSATRVQRHITIRLPSNDPELGIFQGTFVFIDGMTGQVVPLTYICIKDSDTNEEVVVLRNDIDSFDPSSWVPRKVSIEIRAENEAEWKEIAGKLKTMGFQHEFVFQVLDASVVLRKQPPVEIEAKITRTTKRALAKILLNYAAKYIGVDEVLKPQWNSVRAFVRDDQGDLSMKIETKEPFWDSERTNNRLPPEGYNIIVQVTDDGVAGTIEFFNLLTYHILLIPGYEFPQEKSSGHRFLPGREPQQAVKVRKDSGIILADFDSNGRIRIVC